MKRILLLIFVSLNVCLLAAQTIDDIGRISIKVREPDGNNIPDESKALLVDRSKQIIANNGIVDEGFDNRFEMTSQASIISKDIISGSPVRVSMKLEVAFYIKDVSENKTYGSASVSVVGVGQNENKAFIAAFNNINSNNAKVSEMVNSAKEAIIRYYLTNAGNIINEAYSLSQRGFYDEALMELAKIPDVCTDAHEKARNATYEIYINKINAEGEDLLKKARMEWTASPNVNGAVSAASYLDRISLLSSCMGEVNKLLDEMNAKVRDDDRKAWEFKMQQYADNKAREQRDFEFKVRKYEEAEVKEEKRHQEDVAREQRNFEFAVHQFDETMSYKRAVVDASKEAVISVARALK